MSQEARLHVLNKKHPDFDSAIKDLDYLGDYEEAIVADLNSQRGDALVMYLADRFEPFVLLTTVGEWVSVKAQIESDLECFRKGELPEDLKGVEAFVNVVQPHHGDTRAFERTNAEGEVELVLALQELLDAVKNTNLKDEDLFVVRTWW